MKVISMMSAAVMAICLVVGTIALQADDNSLQRKIVAKEREELDALKSGDHKAFADLLADDATFLDSHGHGTKAEVVEHTADLRLLEYTVEDVRFVPLSAKSGLIAYKLMEKGTSGGKEFTAHSYASAVWAERGGKWVCLFSQETPARH